MDQITEADLESLKENEVFEKKGIEYKRELNIESRDERKEFLADVSSFANASGGDLIIGIIEKDGVPDVIGGLEKEVIDDLKGKIEGLLRDGTEPRLNVDIREVSLSNSKYVLIIRIHYSWRSPHRVLMRDNRFFSRNSNGKYPLDIIEIRNAFNLSDTLIDKIRTFREGRLSKIAANKAPIPLTDNGKTVIHIIPINAFYLGRNYDMNKINHGDLKLISGSRPYRQRYNLDGILGYDQDAEYVQLFRSGIIEAVDEGFTQQSPDGLSIPSGLYEPALIEAFKNYLRVLTTLNVETPVFVFLSLVGVKGYTMATNTLVFRNERRRDHYLIDRDCLLLPEIIIEDYASNIENLMKNCFDSLWNACGYSSSPHYNEEGKWELK